MNKRLIYIILFAILYISVGLVSTIHAISFFGLANNSILGTILAITFEVGQAAVLFSILTTPNERKKIMPWVLMCILTLVQILGNVFSSYKYLITNSSDDLRFFKEPIFIWMDLPDNMANVILTYIIGAILPIVALCMTGMVTNYLGENEKENNKKLLKSEKQEESVNVPEIEIEENKEKENKVEKNKKETNEIKNEIKEETEENNKLENKKQSHFLNL